MASNPVDMGSVGGFVGTQHQSVVRLLHVDEAVERGVDVERDTAPLDDDVAGIRTLG